MGGIGGTFSSLTWMYFLGAGVTLYQLSRAWPEFWNGEGSGRGRQLAGGVAFFLLLPIGVLLHEFGHMLAIWSVGQRVFGLHYFFYWGYVEWGGGSNLQNWYVALAGNFASYLLGLAALVAAVKIKTRHPVINIVLAYVGILELVQTLIMYPLMSLDPSFEGDWDTIYSFAAPVASGITLAVHAVSLFMFIVFMQRNREAKRLLGT